MAAHTSWASSGVAVLPVPIAQTGSYAITMLDLLGLEPVQAGVELVVQCATCAPASRTSRPSPTHRMGVRPAASAALTLALTSASSSWWYCRALRVPDHHVRAAQLGQHRPEMSPVYAPLACGDRSCAPYRIEQLVAVDRGLHAAQVGERRQHDHLDVGRAAAR
jgi:hypothetical protein